MVGKKNKTNQRGRLLNTIQYIVIFKQAVNHRHCLLMVRCPADAANTPSSLQSKKTPKSNSNYLRLACMKRDTVVMAMDTLISSVYYCQGGIDLTDGLL